MQDGADGPLGQFHIEAFPDDLLQIDPPPADDAVDLHIRTLAHDFGQLRLLLWGQPCSAPALRGVVGQADEPLVVEPMHPVSQRLPVHSAGPSRILPRAPFKNQGDRQHPPGRVAIPRPPGLAPKIGGSILRPRHSHCWWHAPSVSRYNT